MGKHSGVNAGLVLLMGCTAMLFGEADPGRGEGLVAWRLVSSARAEDAAGEPVSLEQYCRSWASNAMMGAKVALRGGARTLAYINETQLRYLLKHQAAGNQLYLLDGPYTAAEKRYLEDALLAGYDRAAEWSHGHGNDTADTQGWETQIHQACMSDPPEAVRAVLAESR